MLLDLLVLKRCIIPIFRDTVAGVTVAKEIHARQSRPFVAIREAGEALTAFDRDASAGLTECPPAGRMQTPESSPSLDEFPMTRIVVSENVTGPPLDALQASHDVFFAPDLWNDEAALRDALHDAEALIVTAS